MIIEKNEDAAVIYNVTTQVNMDASEAWLQWMFDVHLPAIMQTCCFEKYQVTRLLIDSDDVASFAIQFYATNMAQYNKYIEQHGFKLERQVVETWGTESVSFATLMQIIS